MKKSAQSVDQALTLPTSSSSTRSAKPAASAHAADIVPFVLPEELIILIVAFLPIAIVMFLVYLGMRRPK
ncbi:MAG: hypothetical protein M3306_24940 [Actinomycetota bacterium]|nr:hypothetical protein [Actinomycetota bacterium]